MQTFVTSLPYMQVVLAVLLVGAILAQKSDAGLDGTFGGSDNFSASYRTRRGFEKFLFDATIVLAILFIAASIAALLLS